MVPFATVIILFFWSIAERFVNNELLKFFQIKPKQIETTEEVAPMSKELIPIYDNKKLSENFTDHNQKIIMIGMELIKSISNKSVSQQNTFINNNILDNEKSVGMICITYLLTIMIICIKCRCSLN